MVLEGNAKVLNDPSSLAEEFNLAFPSGDPNRSSYSVAELIMFVGVLRGSMTFSGLPRTSN